ncbi:transposase [Novipirellula artificiosorum]|uniref:Transposase IS200 like protein n=1 Tax=Novipirellula artificiosorum TaxID=2528016 RepID=A0A5C6DX90_9BACT|nr:transposase [Novipirellula artificiosorum]TWU39636.1 Transposase IS200 like protein [Novipirellula artificiosorum]
MEIIHKRALPHWYVSGAAYFVTYRIAGTLPISVIKELRERKQQLLARPPDCPDDGYRGYVNKLLFAAYEKHLDQMSDIDWLRDPRIASILRQNLYHHDSSKYHLHAYCIMPNHVHVLFTPCPLELVKHSNEEEHTVGETPDAGSPLSRIMHSLKSYTANQANKVMKRTGTFWQPESYDHWVRDDEELERIVFYIRGNPVSAGLVTRHQDWYWSSCHDRLLLDGDTSAWLP